MALINEAHSEEILAMESEILEVPSPSNVSKYETRQINRTCSVIKSKIVVPTIRLCLSNRWRCGAFKEKNQCLSGKHPVPSRREL